MENGSFFNYAQLFKPIMDIESFRSSLPAVFGGDLTAAHPVDRKFRALMDDVPGMASENKLALLNLAAGLLGSGESYLEIGSYQGLSIIAAMLGNEGARFYAMESFREFGVERAEALPALTANLQRWGVRERLRFFEGDCFAVLGRNGHEAEGPAPVGVYFYDGSHGRMAHYLALGMAEPWLADHALVIVDDASWPVVREPTERYAATHPGYELLFDLRSEREFDPKWWNGVLVYAYHRPEVGSGVRRRDLAWRRSFYLNAYEPAQWAAGKVLYRHPALLRAVKRVVLTPARKVKTGEPS